MYFLARCIAVSAILPRWVTSCVMYRKSYRSRRTSSRLKADNEKYGRHCPVLIIYDDPQRRREVRDTNRHKARAPFQYTDSLFTA